ncbi:TBC domain-containing protein C4G8.04 like [Verticillium longisporum]|nr:TBC domain-containing protein C4G8.04 like [Verticillium longisporum]
MDDDASTPTPAQATPTMPAVAVAAASPRTRTPTPPSLPLERSISQRSVSVASVRSSSRSTTLRTRSKRLPSHVSSSASSIIAADDKSLTSFPSLSPEAPKPVRPFADQEPNTYASVPRTASGAVSVAESDAPLSLPDDTLTEGDVAAPPPALPTRPSQSARSALFEDSPIAAQKIPGALHTADDEHLDRLVKRHGAKELVRMIATDLAHRDAQIALLRRKADERERALRKIILECGLSNLELETKLRAVETENKASRPGNHRAESGLSDLMSDAMQDTVTQNVYGQTDTEGTIRATSLSLASNADPGTNKGTTRGWKDFLWGGSKRGSVASSINGDDPRSKTIVRTQSHADRRPGLQDDLFNPPPDTTSLRSASRASSISSVAPSPRKPSGVTASLLRLVAGGAMAGRDVDPIRGRSNSATHARQARASSSASGRTTGSSRAVSNQSNPKALMAMQRAIPAGLGGSATVRAPPQERWDTMVGSPPNVTSRQESYGPVEMDAILPPETQPPTLNVLNSNHLNGELLTDRFGFIYDQRRKKRQREANKPPRRHSKRASLTEMLTNGRPIISPPMDEPSIAEERPDSPSSTEEPAEDRPRKWQDYLKMATFPTELLSHTPALSASSLEVLESYDQPRSSPGLIADERGFVPAAASTTTSVADLEAVPPETEGGTSVIEDAEPVKLLLQHQNELHDRLQRERTPRWNEFLRKVRVERQREREAATAAAHAAAEARYERPSVILPEAALADGELIGITGLGTKGKVGRAKRLEFRNLVFGGIPVAIRPKVWFECSGAAHLRVPGYYQDLVARSDKGLGEDVVREIKADVTRTLTHNTFFRNGAPGVQRLDDILTAYACRNPHIGYCQGMNLITANLLLVTPSAEDAFWILARIVESICPTDYYDKSLLTARADQQVLRQLVTEILPRLSDHLDYLGVDLQIMSFQWFLSVFTDCLSAEALFRVWDVVLCMEEGSLFLFQVAVALLKLNETQILQCDSSTAAYTYLNHQMTNHAISIDNMIKASEALRRYIQKEDVDARRKSAIQAMKIAADEREEANAARRAQREDAETAAAASV